MKREIVTPIHRAIDKEAIRNGIRHVGVKGLDIAKAEELGIMSRISNLLCAMHCLTMTAHRIYGEVDYWFGVAGVKKHEIKRACAEFENAYDRWFKFWRGYQTVDGVLEMNSQMEDLLEQYMRWSQIPVQWNPGDKQDAYSEHEPMIEIDKGDKILRVYRDIVESELVDVVEEWAVMRADTTEGKSTMTCVERGMDKASAQMSAKRASANEHGRLYTASKLETITEKRLECIPIKAFQDGEMIGDIKSVIR